MIEIPSSLFQVKIGESQIELDLIEVQLTIEKHDEPMDRIVAIQNLCKPTIINIGEAWAIIVAASDAFDDFKKKLPESLQSRITTSSIQPLSMNALSTSYGGT